MKKIPLLLILASIILLLIFFVKTNDLDLSQDAPTDISELQLEKFLFFIATKENIQVFGSPQEKKEITSFLSNSAPLVGVPFLQLSPHELLVATTRALFLASQNGIRDVFVPDEGVIENISFDKNDNVVLVNIKKDETHVFTAYLSIDLNEDGEREPKVVKSVSSSIASEPPASEKLKEFCDNLICQLSGTLVAPDRKTKLIAETNSNPFFRTYTLSRSSNDGEKLILKETTSFFSDHLDAVQWLSDNRHILLTVSHDNTNLFYVFDTKDHKSAFLDAGDEMDWIELE